MNYIQITINGKLVGLKFGMLATQLFFEVIEKGKRVMIGDTVNELGISYLLYFGYVNNCEVKQVDPELTFEDFYNLVEVSLDGNSEIMKALECWSTSQPMQKAIEGIEQAKKKSVGKKLKEQPSSTD